MWEKVLLNVLKSGATPPRRKTQDKGFSRIYAHQDKQRSYYSGKKKRHTLKSQVVVETESLKVICTAHGTGKEHDFQLFKQSLVKPLKQIEILADKGYQGIKKIHRLSYTPIKKKKKQPLASTEKETARSAARQGVLGA